jgi:hypothetical protein
MSSKPYFAEGTLFGENNLGIKHNEESASLCERERERKNVRNLNKKNGTKTR